MAPWALRRMKAELERVRAQVARLAKELGVDLDAGATDEG